MAGESLHKTLRLDSQGLMLEAWQSHLGGVAGKVKWILLSISAAKHDILRF
jgi:hypothetical protein